MKIKQRVLAILTTLAVFTGVMVVQATPAHAAWSDCPNYAICIFDGTGGGAPLYYWSEASYTSYSCINIGGSWSDRAGSVYNRTPAWIWYVRFWEHSNCGGDGNPAGLLTYNGQMKTFGTGSGLTQYNNMISSFFVAGI